MVWLYGIQMAFNTGPYCVRPLFDQFNTEMIWFLNAQCLCFEDIVRISIPNILTMELFDNSLFVVVC